MKSLVLKFYEHSMVPGGEAIYVCRQDDPRLPGGLRGLIEVPCVVARDLARFRQTLTLLRIAELWEEAAPFRQLPRNARPRYPLARLGGSARHSQSTRQEERQ